MKYPAILLASFCISLQAISQQQTLPVLQTFYVRGESGDDLVPSSQQSSQYDKEGRLRVNKNYGWIEEEKRWAPGQSVESDYDDVGNLIRQKSIFWRALTDTIDYVHTITQTFDAQNRLIEYDIFDEQPSYGHDFRTRLVYTYDQNGCNNEIMLQYFFNGAFQNERVINNLTDDQCRAQVIRSYPTAITEGPHEATVYTYDDNSEVARHVYYVDPDTTLTEEYFFEYDQSGRLVGDQRTDVSRSFYDYDEAGNLIRQWYDIWDSETMSWERSSEHYQTFDSDNSLLMRENHFSPTPTGTWLYSQFESYEYNDDGMPLRLHSRSVYNFGSASEFRSVKEFSYRCDGLETETISTIIQGDNPGIASRTTTAYNHPSGCDNTQNSPVVIIPNPASGLVRLLLPEVRAAMTIHIISSNGQLASVITTDKGINPVELDVSGLAAGLYIIQVIAEGYVASGRLVKN